MYQIKVHTRSMVVCGDPQPHIGTQQQAQELTKQLAEVIENGTPFYIEAAGEYHLVHPDAVEVLSVVRCAAVRPSGAEVQ